MAKDAHTKSPAEVSNPASGFIPITETAREALIKDLVAEMTRDSLKETALARLKKANWLELISRFFQHPVILLLIGFAVTAWIGGWLTNRWQKKEWDRQQLAQTKEWERQQLRLLDIHGIDTKYKLIEELTRAVGQRNAAARGILSPLAQGFTNRDLLAEEKEPISNWSKACAEWRAASQILKLKIATHIKSQESEKVFDQIIDDQRQITAALDAVKSELTQYNQTEDKEARKHLDGILSLLQRTEQSLKQLVALIASEARFEIKTGQ